jgi:general secretion pathway protein C
MEAEPRPSADRILARNAFEHGAALGPVPPFEAPADCTGLRALVVVHAEDEEASLVALAIGEERVLRRRGQSVGQIVVAAIGSDRAWLTLPDATTCEARVFGPSVHPEPKLKSGDPIVPGIARISANEVHVDRGTLDRFLENPGELTKIRALPEAKGVKLAKVPQNSVVALLGLEEGDRLLSAGGIELTSMEKIMELYARLRTFEKLAMVVEREGKPMTIDYVIK